jgi:hypothetical protein
MAVLKQRLARGMRAAANDDNPAMVVDDGSFYFFAPIWNCPRS